MSFFLQIRGAVYLIYHPQSSRPFEDSTKPKQHKLHSLIKCTLPIRKLWLFVITNSQECRREPWLNAACNFVGYQANLCFNQQQKLNCSLEGTGNIGGKMSILSVTLLLSQDEKALAESERIEASCKTVPIDCQVSILRK